MKPPKIKKKMIVYVILVLLVSVPIINLSIAGFRSLPGKQLLRIGHRGAAGLAPENTMPAIDSGIAFGCDYIEIDVRETKDSQLIIMHDKKVNRTTNGNGAIHNLNYSEISGLNASESFSNFNGAAKVPLLKEVLSRVKVSDAKLLIEIKDINLYPHLEDILVKLVRETGTMDKVAIFSFNKGIVRRIQKQLPGVETGYFCIGLEYPTDSATYISPNWISILYFPFIVKKIQKQGAKVLVWTPNQSSWMTYLRKMNVDGIITDRPDVLAKLLNADNSQ